MSLFLELYQAGMLTLIFITVSGLYQKMGGPRDDR